MKQESVKLNCWQCGDLLEQLPRRIPRYEACPSCRAELHCCRMCRHYDPKVIGACRHDKADRVERKQESNYCTYFRPRPRAHEVEIERTANDSSDELNALFGLPQEQGRSEASGTPDAGALFDLPVEKETLDAASLFDLPSPDDDAGDEEPSRERS